MSFKVAQFDLYSVVVGSCHHQYIKIAMKKARMGFQPAVQTHSLPRATQADRIKSTPPIEGTLNHVIVNHRYYSRTGTFQLEERPFSRTEIGEDPSCGYGSRFVQIQYIEFSKSG